jgi:hypothetical protein
MFLLHGCGGSDGITGTGVVDPATTPLSPTPPPSPSPTPTPTPTPTGGGGSGGGGGGGQTTTPRVISGAVQKGPFIVGTLVYANRLSAAGQPTSDTVVTTTQTDIGTFAFELSEPGVLQLFADGFHYNEITGLLSQGRLTLNAILDATSDITPRSYVNALTHLTYNRTLSLLRNGMKAPDAIAKAQADLVTALHPLFAANNLPVFTDMSVYNIGDSSPVGNAYLLAVSATAYQTAITRARVSGTSVDAELTLLLNTLADDLAQDGDIDDRAVIDELIIASRALDPDAIRFNLKQRSVKAINAELAVADLNLFIDTDGDGMVNAEDPDDDNDNIPDALDPQPYVKVVVTGWITSLSPTSVLTGVQVLNVQTNDSRIVASVEYLVNGEVVGQAVAPPYSFEFNPYFWGDEGKAELAVRVTDIGGNVTVSSPMSVSILPGVAALLTLTPSDGAVLSDTVTPELSWIVGGRPSNYEVQLWDVWSDAPLSISRLLNENKLTVPPLTVGVYQWRVRAGTPANHWGPWTAVHNFTLTGPKAPQLNFPTNATSVAPGATLKFDWSGPQAASEYQLQISRTGTFDLPIVDVVTSSLNFTGSFATGKHYWRVRAKNVLGYFGAWSEVRTFGAGLFAVSFENLDVKDAVALPDGGAVFVANEIGSVVPTTSNTRDLKIIRLDAMGNTTAAKLVTQLDTTLDEAKDVEPTADGGYIVLVSRPSTGLFSSDQKTTLIKLDATLNVEWSQSYSKPCVTDCWPDQKIQVAADGYVVLGTELWKTNLQGGRIWTHPIREVSGTFSYSPSATFELAADGASYLSGHNEYLSDNLSILSRTYLMCINADGTEAWRHFGNGISGSTDTMERLADGSFLLVDYFGGPRFEKYDAAGFYVDAYYDPSFLNTNSFYTSLTTNRVVADTTGGFYVLRWFTSGTGIANSVEIVRFNAQLRDVGHTTVLVTRDSFAPSITAYPNGMLLVTAGPGLVVVDPIEGSLLSPTAPTP